MALDIILTPYADQGDKTQPPQSSPTGFANFLDGYTKDYEISLKSGNPQAKAVERMIQNYLFNQTNEHAKAWQSMNRPPWFAIMPGGYGVNAEVLRDNGSGLLTPYRSLVANNVTDPQTSPTWERVPTYAEVLKNIPMPSGGPAGSASEVIIAATDFDTLVSPGTFELATNAVAAGSPNCPSTLMGMLEVKSWTAASLTSVVQRYFDISGITYTRAKTGGAAFTAWRKQVVIADVPMPAGALSGASSEIVSVATDFNTLVNSGTMEFATNAVAAASPNTPSTFMGMLEVKTWTSASVTNIVQRYTDISGAIFMRGKSGAAAFTAWQTLAVQATETVAGIAEISTQSEMDAGVSDSVIATPKKIRNGFAFLIAAVGYITFPTWLGGFIIQWGFTNTLASGTTIASFPTAFTSTVFGAIAVANSTTFQFATVPTQTLTNVSLFAFASNTGAQQTVQVRWFAWGK